MNGNFAMLASKGSLRRLSINTIGAQLQIIVALSVQTDPAILPWFLALDIIAISSLVFRIPHFGYYSKKWIIAQVVMGP